MEVFVISKKGRSMQFIKKLFFLLLVFLYIIVDTSLIASIQNSKETSTKNDKGKVLNLHGEELGNAWKEIDQADLMRAEFEEKYVWTQPNQDLTPISASAREEFGKIEQAYINGIKKYPKTEIALYSGLRLSGLYCYRREYDRAIEQTKEVASQFSGTDLEHTANFDVGLYYLQAKNDPDEATKWFKKIPKPSNLEKVDSENYNGNEALYLSAQQSIAKCELQMNKHAEAKQRYEKLVERYPQYKKELAQHLKTDSISNVERLLNININSIEDKIISPSLTHYKNKLDDITLDEISAKIDTTEKTKNINLNYTETQDNSNIKDSTQVSKSYNSKKVSSYYFIWLGILFLLIGIFLCIVCVYNFFVNRHSAGRE